MIDDVAALEAAEQAARTAPPPDVVSAELVRLTLGGRGPSRLELRVDLLGKVYQAARMVADHMRTSWLAAARAIAGAGITPPRTP